MMAKRWIKVCGLVLAAGTMVGCLDEAKDLFGGDDDGRAAQAYDSFEVTSTETALLLAVADSAVAPNTTSSDEELAAAVEAAATTTFSPETCVQTTRTSNVIGYKFTNCSGPYGLTNLSGEAAVTVARSGSDFSLTVSMADGQSLKTGDGTLAVSTSGLVTPGASGTHRMAVTSTGGGTGPGGTVLTRNGNYVVDWSATEGCTTFVNGNWQTTVDDSVWNTSVSNIEVCKPMCPTKGTLVFTGTEAERTVTITFDGSNRPYFGSTDLTPATVTLPCTGASNG